VQTTVLMREIDTEYRQLSGLSDRAFIRSFTVELIPRHYWYLALILAGHLINPVTLFPRQIVTLIIASMTTLTAVIRCNV
jgi:hypothetical protein